MNEHATLTLCIGYAIMITSEAMSSQRSHTYAWFPAFRCRSHLPLCRNCRSVANRIESYFFPFCRWWTTNQRSGHFIPVHTETFPAIPFSRATATAATAAKAQRQRQNGNGMLETRQESSTSKMCPESCIFDITPIGFFTCSPRSTV